MKIQKKTISKLLPSQSDPNPPVTIPENTDFPIIGVGASAGGLEALQLFFSAMPSDTELTFVVIQHLSPTYKSIMDTLLRKHTAMKVAQAVAGALLEPNHIYLNLPGKNLILKDRRFEFRDPEPQGVNFPIDVFFRSLAEQQREKAISIILSGTGSDGALGIQAVKGAGGMVMVQDEAQAQYTGMIDSAIATGMVDLALPVEDMPAELIKYIRSPFLNHVTPEQLSDESSDLHFQKIFKQIQALTGHDFSEYKTATLRRRIQRRMAIHRFEAVEEYLRYLMKTPTETQFLFKDILIGVTGFFRDPEAFEILSRQILPELILQKLPDIPLRVWIPGCATGEEAYSIAMLVVDAMEKQKVHIPVQIFASDLDPQAINAARAAIYPENIAADVSLPRLERYFIKEGNTFKVKQHIREMVVFTVQNLIKDPPFSKLDLLSCRNLLIYLNANLQKKLFPLFHYTLVHHGVLFLGPSESIGEFCDLFTPLDAKWKIYRRQAAALAKLYALPSGMLSQQRESTEKSHPKEKISPINIHRLAEKIMLDNYTLPGVLIDHRGDILYFIGPTERFLKPPFGEPVFNIIRMAREELRYKLSIAIQQAIAEKRKIITQRLKIVHRGLIQTVSIIIRPVAEMADPTGLMLVIFNDHPPPELPIDSTVPENPEEHCEKDFDPRVISLEQELLSNREYLKTTIEELETSNEELKSTNEELQSVNEELQSRNEELETLKEELQSTNEEMVTVNAELQSKVADLSHLNNNMNNLLNSTNIGTLFLDNQLCIKWFTPVTKSIFNLLQTDIGRPFSHITGTITYDLIAAVKQVLDTLNTIEKDIQSNAGIWYHIRIMPYRTLDNVIDGTVIVFIDQTRLKQMEIQEHNARLYAESIVSTVRSPLIILNSQLQVKTANKSFYREFRVIPEETQGRRIYELGDGQWNIPRLRQLLEQIIPDNETFSGYEIIHDFPRIGNKRLWLNARRIGQTGEQAALILLEIEDITDRTDSDVFPE